MCAGNKTPRASGRARRRWNRHRQRVATAAPAARLVRSRRLGAFWRTSAPGRLAGPGLAPLRDQAGETTGGKLALHLRGGSGRCSRGRRVHWEPQPVGRFAPEYPPELPVPGWPPDQNRCWDCRSGFSAAGCIPFRMFKFPFPGCTCTSTAFKSSPGVLKSVRRTVSKEKFFSPSSVASHPAGQVGTQHQQIAGM